MSNDELSRVQMIERYTDLKRTIQKAQTPANCGLGEAMQVLGVLLCETQIYHLKQPPSCMSFQSMAARIVSHAPWAATVCFVAWVFAKARGIL